VIFCRISVETGQYRFGDKEVVVIVGERPGALFAVCAMQRRIEYAIMRKRPLSSGECSAEE